MADLVRLGERILVIMGLMYMAGSFDKLLPGAFSSLIQYGVYGVAILLLLARWQRTVRTALRDKFLWILLTIVICSFLWSDFPSDSLRSGIVAWQTACFSLYVASCYTLKQQICLMSWAMGIASVLAILYTLAMPGMGIHMAGEHAGAWRGLYAHKNSLSQIAAYSAIVLLFLPATQRGWHRYLGWGLFGLAVGLLLLSTSKTGLMVFLCSMTLFRLYKAVRWRNTNSILILVIIILIFSAVVILLVGNAEAVLNALGRDLTLTGRTEIWGGAIGYIKQQPWFGYGRAGFWHPKSGKALAIGEELGANYAPPHSHNGFVDVSCDLGLIGLGFFLLSFITTFAKAYKQVRLTGKTEDIFPVMYVSFFLLYNFTESSFLRHNSVLWASYMIVALSVGKISQKRPRNKLQLQEIQIPSLLLKSRENNNITKEKNVETSNFPQ